MNKKLAFVAMSVPTMVGSGLAPMMPVRPAHAEVLPSQADIVCDRPSRFNANQLECRRIDTTPRSFAVVRPASVPLEVLAPAAEAGPVEQPDLDFSYAESHASIALFGCDCPACLNSLRTLRNMLPVVDDGRDPCWVVSNQGYRNDPDQVLSALDAAEANNTDFPLEDFIALEFAAD
jgi:hypothetical protein